MKEEFIITAKYLLNIDRVPDELITSYNSALKNHDVTLTNYEKKVWNRMLRNRFVFGIYDSGFSFIDSQSHIRKRIFIALAILECSPFFTRHFLNETLILKDFMSLAIQIPTAIFKAIIGSFLVYFKL